MRSLITGEDLKKKSLCASCGLYRSCKSPYMSYTGKGEKEILLYGEAPGKDEDENWEELGYSEPTQFIGEAGQLLEEVLADNGIDIREDCWCINAINCRPPGNRTPTVKEISCCKPRVDKVIEELKPKFIFLLGGTAVESFYHGRFTNKSISNWRKLCIPDKGVNVWVIPLYHPSYILRNKGNLNLESTFKQDFKWAASCIKSMGQPFFVPFEDRVVILKDYKETIKVLKYILDEVKLISYDYETTGLKPYGSEQKIWCVSICDGDKSYSLPVSYPWWETEQEEKVKQYLRRILSRGSIKKVGHKLGFEDLWSRVKLAADTKGNYWCTKVFAHILDSRPDSSFFTGLKFQSYIHFGVDDYETEVEDYIVPKKGSKVNRLDEVDIDKLLLYCGGDSWYTFKHYERQKTVFSKNKGLTQAKDLFLDGLLALTDAQINGIPIDEIYFLEEEQTLQDKIDSLEYKLLNGREAKKYKEVTGKKLTILNKDFSAGDLRILFFDVLGLTAGKKTKKAGLDSVDAEVLLNLKHLFAKRIVERRKAHKLKNTYIAQFKRELYNGKVHPFGELHTASSFRSSMSRPSFQNIPTRDEESKAAIRRGVIPSSGNKIKCDDYDGAEVRIAACETKDPVLVDYIKTGFDMHNEQAKNIFALTDKQVTYDLRFYAKNQFVFPEFYGSYYAQCSRNLMENCFHLRTSEDVLITKHLKNVGVLGANKKYWGKDFEGHVKQVEKDFWGKFYAFREWQVKCQETYRKKGYIETLMGFRRGGFLSNNQVLNTPIQATAFHCLLWSFIRLNKIMQRRKYKSKLIAQIHDEIMTDLNPEEEGELSVLTRRVMCNDLANRFDWLIVPMKTETEITGVDESWYYIKEIK